MSVALAVTGIATVGIGIFPDLFIRAAGWSLSIAQPLQLTSLFH